MNEEFIKIIREIINGDLQKVLDDHKRFINLLSDKCGDKFEVELYIVQLALKKNIPAKLSSSPRGISVDYLIDQQARLLKKSYSLDEDAAKDAVEIWAIALGILNTPLPRQQVITQPSYLATSYPHQTTNNLITVLGPGVEMEFVRVPAGEFLMGSDTRIDPEADDDEQPQHKVYLDEYLIGKYPVTNRQYAAFVKATGQRVSFYRFSNEEEDHPVKNVSYEDAVSFCNWATIAGGKAIRLPTEAEWEKAARGTDRRIYPWGNQKPDETLCNFICNVKHTTPVYDYSPNGDSPYGCADMAGNVWEWVNDWYGENYYRNSPEHNPSGPTRGNWRILRGGSWCYVARFVRVSLRGRIVSTSRYIDYGFRCVR